MVWQQLWQCRSQHAAVLVTHHRQTATLHPITMTAMQRQTMMQRRTMPMQQMTVQRTMPMRQMTAQRRADLHTAALRLARITQISQLPSSLSIIRQTASRTALWQNTSRHSIRSIQTSLSRQKASQTMHRQRF